jgi:hypothetical protein
MQNIDMNNRKDRDISKLFLIKTLIVIFLHPLLFLPAIGVTIALGLYWNISTNVVLLNGSAFLALIILIFLIRFLYFKYRLQQSSVDSNFLTILSIFINNQTIFLYLPTILVLIIFLGELEGNVFAFVMMGWFLFALPATVYIFYSNYKLLRKLKTKNIGIDKYNLSLQHYLLGMLVVIMFGLTVFTNITGTNIPFSVMYDWNPLIGKPIISKMGVVNHNAKVLGNDFYEYNGKLVFKNMAVTELTDTVDLSGKAIRGYEQLIVNNFKILNDKTFVNDGHEYIQENRNNTVRRIDNTLKRSKNLYEMLNDQSVKEKLKDFKCNILAENNIESNLKEARKVLHNNDINNAIQQLKWAREKIILQGNELSVIKISLRDWQYQLEQTVRTIGYYQEANGKNLDINDYVLTNQEKMETLNSDIANFKIVQIMVNETVKDVPCN